VLTLPARRGAVGGRCISSAWGHSSGRHRRQAHQRQRQRQRHRQFGPVIVLVGQLAGKVVAIGRHVEVAVATQLEQDGLGPAFAPAALRFLDRAPDVRIVTRHLQLQDGFLAEDGLMQQHMVEHRTERVFGVVALSGQLDRFADHDAQAAGVIGALGQDGAARLRQLRR
jgi:hypothetical protein